MIEVVYNEEKKKAVGNEGFFHIPKNIRQIGETDPHFKIYIEDYAYHYLDRIADEMSGGKVALLLGQSNWADGITYIFIKSAFCLKDMEVDENHILFNEEVWKKAGEMIDTRFQNQKVVGWCFARPELELELTEAMYRAHMNYFAGNDKVLLLMEPLDSEEAFFRYANGKICRQRGYYLYYERNDAMQEFMIEENQNQPMEHKGVVPDRAVKDFREIIAHKKEDKEEEKPKEKQGSYFMYATAAAAVILALALGTNYLNGYGKLQDTQKAADKLFAQIYQNSEKAESGEKETEEDKSDEESRDVVTWETVRGEDLETSAGAVLEEDSKESLLTEEEEDQQEEETIKADEEALPTPETPSEEGEEASEETAGNLTKGRTYVIRQGDTLTSISRDIYGNIGMIGKICEENGMTKESVIYPGEKILLP